MNRRAKCNPGEAVRKLDSSGLKYETPLDKDGHTSLQTIQGGMINLIFKLVLLTYAGYKFYYAWQRDNMQLLQFTKKNFYDQKETFGAE